MILITGATEEYDGTTWTSFQYRFKYSKRMFRRSRYTNSSIRFWWLCPHQLIPTGATEEYDGS
jgi:hypothetical protein